MPKVNLSKVSEEGYSECIPAGVYLCTIIKCGETTTKAGDPMFKLELKVKGGDYKGHTVWDQIAFVPGGLPRLKMLLKQVGIACDNDIDIEATSLAGAEVYAMLEIEVYDKKERNRVSFDGYHSKWVPKEVADIKAQLKGDSDDLPF